MEIDSKINKSRHSLSHLLAMAVLEECPKAKLAIGPVIENGFYYDFEFSRDFKLSSEDLPKLEKKIKHYIKQNLKFEKIENEEDEFVNQPYKLELINELKEQGEKLNFYKSGDFVDLCSGPHIESAKQINPDSFKLTKIAGAYWRGDEKNTMLTRIYGLAFENKEELDEHLKLLKEMEERDHRKIGKEMDLFVFSDLIGSGLPMFTPKGTIIRNELQNSLINISKKYGMDLVTIPHIAKRKLYEISGHAEKFGDELIKVISHYDEFVMKPVNCPHHTQIYASKQRSYRDLPIRFMESTMMYRDEKPGEISGLTRVRAITVDDGHIFCRTDQIKDEAKNIANIIKEFYSGFGMYGNHWVSLSVRDPKNLDKYIGENEDWGKAEAMLQELSDELKLNAKKVEGEAAIYGPKLDFVFKDALNREWQLATIQIDFSMPKRFGLVYTDNKGAEQTPVMIHRAILGSYERFMAIMIEHFAGNFPLWLSPVQIKVLPIADAHKKYAEEVFEKLKENNIRAELDDNNKTLGKKIRQSKLEKVPYFIVLGDKEVGDKTATLEGRNNYKETADIDTIIEKLKNEIENKVL